MQTLASLEYPVTLFHLDAQPEDPGDLAAQRSFSAEYLWFQVVKLHARSHFPMYKAPDEMAIAIKRFATLALEGLAQ